MIEDELRSLVSEGEANTALDLMRNFLVGRAAGPNGKMIKPMLDVAIVLGGRVKRLELNNIQGTITPSELEVQRARLDQAILGLIREVEHINSFHPPVVSIEFPSWASSEKLTGNESQLRSTGWLAEGLRLASAVCRLTDGMTLGTGFRCASDMVLTNHHVINTIEAAENFKAEFFFEEDASRKLRMPVSVALDPKRLFWTSERLDISLIGLSPVSRDDVAVIPLSPAISAKIHDRVSIIQHPSGGPKQIAVTNNKIINLYDVYVQYMTDTLPGSSGSPVLLDTWQALAIHHAGGNIQKNAQGDVIFANEGILVSALLSDSSFANAYNSSY